MLFTAFDAKKQRRLLFRSSPHILTVSQSSFRKDDFLFQTVSYTIQSRRLPKAFDGFRIVHLSDLHGAVFGPDNQLLLQAIRTAAPHLIAMTGDMADDRGNAVSVFTDLCPHLAAFCPVYYVLGNHEAVLPADQLSKLTKTLQNLGIQILDNQWQTVSFGGGFIRIYGLVHPLVYYKDPLGEYRRGAHFSAQDTKKALGKPDPASFHLLMAHNPLYFPSYRQWGADLTLSGHVHGGVIRIPGLGGLLSPDLTLFPRYDGGHFEENGKQLIVSRGLGNRTFRRIHNPPELVVITLSA